MPKFPSKIVSFLLHFALIDVCVVEVVLLLLMLSLLMLLLLLLMLLLLLCIQQNEIIRFILKGLKCKKIFLFVEEIFKEFFYFTICSDLNSEEPTEGSPYNMH